MDELEICYASAGDLGRLIRDGEISPVEIIEAHLSRIRATEPVLNSFITLLPDEAFGAGASGRAGHPCRTLPRPPPRHSRGPEGPVQHRWSPHHLRLPHLRQLRPRRGLHRRREIPPGRRHPPRQAEHAPVRLRPHRREPRLRPHAQPLEPRPRQRRFQRRLRFRHRRRTVHHHHWQRHRRLHPHPRRPLRHRRAQAHLRPRQPPRPDPPCLVHGPPPAPWCAPSKTRPSP